MTHRDQAAWTRGKVLAEGQNFAKYLMEAPANEMTPTIFAKKALEKLGSLENVTVTQRFVMMTVMVFVLLMMMMMIATIMVKAMMAMIALAMIVGEFVDNL